MKNKLKNISCVGYGYVGKAMVEMLRTHYNVFVYDPAFPKDITRKGIGENIYFVDSIEELNQQNSILGVICVPTPMGEGGQCDTSIVKESVEVLEAPVILIKSTVPPGTTDRLKEETGKRIVFSPEYAGESKYWSPYEWDTDMKACPWVTVGGDPMDAEVVFDILAPVLGPTKTYRTTSAKVAELVKYWENTYFAMKVTFTNEMYEICKAMEVPFWEARDVWGLDPRDILMHTAIFKDNRGYGGKCYPKDTNGLVMASKEAGYEPLLLEAMIDANKRFRDLNK